MIRLKILFLCAFLFNLKIEPTIYLWQMNDDYGSSCCLHFGQDDFCNPFVPCTQFIYRDLAGISDYISRLLGLDRVLSDPHETILRRANKFISSAIQNESSSIGYIYDDRVVKFYHHILDEAQKEKKSAPAVKLKDKLLDPMSRYLIRVGLMTPIENLNRHLENPDRF